MNAAILERYQSASLSVLALWEPWAILCVAPDPAYVGLPAKRHETRHWVPRAEVPFAVAIHATKTITTESRAAFNDQRFKDALRRTGFYPGDPRPLLSGRMRASMPPVPLGAIIGVATVTTIYQTAGLIVDSRYPIRENWDLTSDDQVFGNYEPGRFAWQLEDAVMLPTPIPHTGRQDALYAPDIELREAINEQLRAMTQAVAV